MGNFPGSAPTDYNTAGSEVLGEAAVVGVSTILNNLSDEVVALAAKVGTGASTPTANGVLTGNGVGTSAWSTTLAGLTLTSPTINGATLGGTLDMDGEAIALDGDADTTIHANTDDQIDIQIAGSDDFQFTANTFTSLSGSVIKTNTINETTTANGVTVDGMNIKDGAIATANVVDSDQYVDGSIDTVHLSDDSVTDAKRPSANYLFLKRSAVQSAANATDTIISWDTEVDDDGGWWDSGDPTKIYPDPGVYQVEFQYGFAPFSGGTLTYGFLQHRDSSNVIITTAIDRKGSGWNASYEYNGRCSMIIRASSGDYVMASVYQRSGGAVNTSITNEEPKLWMVKISD